MNDSVGSLQLQRYRSARRRGATMMTACAESGIPISEARLIEADAIREAAADPNQPPAPIDAPISKGSDDGQFDSGDGRQHERRPDDK